MPKRTQDQILSAIRLRLIAHALRELNTEELDAESLESLRTAVANNLERAVKAEPTFDKELRAEFKRFDEKHNRGEMSIRLVAFLVRLRNF